MQRTTRPAGLALGLALALSLAAALACTWGGRSGRGDINDGASDDVSDEGAGRGRGRGRGGGGSNRADGWTRTLTLESSGVERTALLHVPSAATDRKPLPLLMLFHGGQSGEDASKMAVHWDHLADQDFAMVFPNGLATDERAWAGPEDQRDFVFVDDLIEAVDRELPGGVDRKRIYAAGFSNGSGFTWMLECFRADRFAGFGHVQQSMAQEVLRRCKPAAQVPTIWFHGDADPKAIWDGNDRTIGVPKTLAFVLDLHRCKPDAVDVTDLPDLPGDSTRVTRNVYRSCKDVPAVELWRIHGGAHHWPTTQRSRRMPDKCSDIDASTEMVRFWREYARL